MKDIQLFSAAGIGVLAVTGVIFTLVGVGIGYKLFVKSHDKPILISDGSLFIQRGDGMPINSWNKDNPEHPSELRPDQAWEGVDIYEDGASKDQCSTSETQCTIDITYYYFIYDPTKTTPMIIRSDKDTFEGWNGYQTSKIVHPKPLGKINAVTVNGRKVDYHGQVKIWIHHTVQ
jgi:hypothetical protein